MKAYLKILIIAAFLVAPLLMFAQAPPHVGDTPPTGTPVDGAPGGAPIGNGTFILLTLAAAYAGRKVYVMRAPANEEVA